MNGALPKNGGATFIPKHISVITHERIWQANVEQKWKPGKHCVWPRPKYEDFFSMLSRHAWQVWGPRCAGSGSWRAVTAGGSTKTPGSGQRASA
eukprot:1160598-Pelagomonas_calceolata.AAC.1